MASVPLVPTSWLYPGLAGPGHPLLRGWVSGLSWAPGTAPQAWPVACPVPPSGHRSVPHAPRTLTPPPSLPFRQPGLRSTRLRQDFPLRSSPSGSASLSASLRSRPRLCSALAHPCPHASLLVLVALSPPVCTSSPNLFLRAVYT